MACGPAFADESGSDWEVSIKGQAKALRMPWVGPFAITANTTTTATVRAKEAVLDAGPGEWFYGGGVKAESFYIGKRIPIQLGIVGYYNSYKSRFTSKEFGRVTDEDKRRRGWSYVDGVNTAHTSAFLLPVDIIFTSVSRKVTDWGLDLIAKKKVSLESGELQLMAGPSFFRMTQRTKMFAYDNEDRETAITRQSSNPDYKNKDIGDMTERVDANYYGLKVGADLALPLSEDFTFLIGANVGGYLLDANYEGDQHMDFSWREVDNRAVWDHHAVISYASEVEAGLEYDTGYGIIGVSGEARYLSKVPLVNYISRGTVTKAAVADIARVDYEPARLDFTNTYSYGANIEYKILF